MLYVLIVVCVLGVVWFLHGHLSEIKMHVEDLVRHTAKAAENTPGDVGTTPVSPSPVVTPPVVTPPTKVLPAGIDTPDARGFVALTGIPADHYYSKLRFAIAEVGAALIGVAHASCVLNSGFLANGRWITSQFIGVCAEIEPITDGTTGAVTYRLKLPQVNVQGTIACPPSWTVAYATAHFSALPDPSTGTSIGFLPGH